MAIIKMKRLHLLALRSDREELLHTLQRMGCVEISEPAEADGRSDAPPGDWEGLTAVLELRTPDGSALTQVQEEKQSAERALSVLSRCGAKGRGMLTPRPQLTEEELFEPAACAAGTRAVEAVLQKDREAALLQAEQGKLTAQKAALAPWLSLDLPLESGSTREMLVQFGTLTAARPLEEAQRTVEEASELAQLIQASAGREVRYCLLVCHKSAQEAVLEALRDFGWSKVSLNRLTGTGQGNDARLDRELSENAERLRQTEEELAGMTGLADDVRRASDRASVLIDREESRARLRDTEQTFLLRGWIPAERWEDTERKLSAYPCAWQVEDPAEEEYPQVPVSLKNNWLTRPLNMVTEMYSLPAYGTVDPNPLMAPFFILFYGMMMADMGYGLLMIFLPLLYLKKARPPESKRGFIELILWCGIVTFIFGALTGGFFGDFIPQLCKVIDPASTFELPSLFSPLNDTMAIMVGSMVLGGIQILTGMTISVVKKTRDGHFADALWDEITWWVILAGGAMALLKVGSVAGVPVVLVIGVLMLVYGSGRGKKGFGKVTGLVSAVYNGVTGFFSDILSYVRLMALMLSGAVLAQVFNMLGATTGNVVGFVVIALIGNALNLALNLLGCYVHDMRLQFLEFFGRFYKEGGKSYRPLSVETQYVEVMKEDN